MVKSDQGKNDDGKTGVAWPNGNVWLVGWFGRVTDGKKHLFENIENVQPSVAVNVLHVICFVEMSYKMCASLSLFLLSPRKKKPTKGKKRIWNMQMGTKINCHCLWLSVFFYHFFSRHVFIRTNQIKNVPSDVCCRKLFRHMKCLLAATTWLIKMIKSLLFSHELVAHTVI